MKNRIGVVAGTLLGLAGLCVGVSAMDEPTSEGGPVQVSFLWHMHQPISVPYVDPRTAETAAFLMGDAATDFNGDGVIDSGGVGAFVAAFLAKC